MTETMVIDRHLTALLAPLGPTFSDVAPPTAASPFIVFSLVDAADVAVVGDVRLWVDAQYVVKVVAEGRSYAAIETLAGLVDSALHGSRAHGIMWVSRIRPVRYAEHAAGKDYRHLGGYYRIQARKE